eukprot:914784_1
MKRANKNCAVNGPPRKRRKLNKYNQKEEIDEKDTNSLPIDQNNNENDKKMNRSRVHVDSENSIFIANLPRKHTKEQMIQILREQFGCYGTIVQITVIPNSSNTIKGFGFIEYSNYNEVEKAILGSDNLKIGGFPVSVESKSHKKIKNKQTFKSDKDVLYEVTQLIVNQLSSAQDANQFYAIQNCFTKKIKNKQTFKSDKDVLYEVTQLIVNQLSSAQDANQFYAIQNCFTKLKYKNKNGRQRKVGTFVKRKYKNWMTYFKTYPMNKLFETQGTKQSFKVRMMADANIDQVMNLLK